MSRREDMSYLLTQCELHSSTSPSSVPDDTGLDTTFGMDPCQISTWQPTDTMLNARGRAGGKSGSYDGSPLPSIQPDPGITPQRIHICSIKRDYIALRSKSRSHDAHGPSAVGETNQHRRVMMSHLTSH